MGTAGKSKYTQNEFRIRRIKKSDNSALSNLIKNVLSEYGVVHSGDMDPELEDIYLSYSKSNCAYFVIEREVDKKIVGGAGISCVMENSVCELRKVYLLPEGRGLGLGEILLNRALSYARRTGYKQCYLEVSHDVDKTNRLSKKSGFIWLVNPIEQGSLRSQ